MMHPFTPVDLFQYGFFFAVDIGMVGIVVLGLLFVFYAVISPPASTDATDATGERED